MSRTLPILISVPHAGLVVPPEAKPFCTLSTEQIVKDGDEGAAAIYALKDDVQEFVTTDIARAIVDLNRSESDRRADGVVKTHTIWNEPIFNQPLPDSTIKVLLERYYHPYHETISDIDDELVKLCVDCHTMAAAGPPIGPDVGRPRPHVCLGDLHGKSMPEGWMELLIKCFHDSFGESVTANDPFSGGYITQRHAANRPWVQVELSRAKFMSEDEKRNGVINALRQFCEHMFG